ncbi:MAG: DUF58 domain-containing protein [Defluviitaleaceae bacterium]|nr:DUF58 domain-containing protein [Defluviitaleaceae bacterium]
MLIIALLFCVAILYFVEIYTTKHALDGINYITETKNMLVEIDEEFSITTVITNSKFMPVLFLNINEILPNDITLAGNFTLVPQEHKPYTNLVYSVYLMPYKRLKRTVKATLPKRGRYTFLGSRLSAGGFLGLSETGKDFNYIYEVVLPPKPFEMEKLKQVLGSFMGDISARRFIIEDPVLTVGFREYTGREPMRQISWSQTAKFTKTMVKNYDYTFDPTVTIVLSPYTEEKTEKDMEQLEILFSMTRSVCDFLETTKVPYKFITNVLTVDYVRQRTVVRDGLGSVHICAILEILGRATYNTMESSEELLTNIAHTAEAGRAHIILTPQKMGPLESASVHKLRLKTGMEVLNLTPESI